MNKSNPLKPVQCLKTISVVTAVLASVHVLIGQTLVSGNISGTWSLSGSPYVAVDNCMVQSGQSLTIEPGVVVQIGSNMTITANGLIQAAGTPAQRITFGGVVSSQYWNTIALNSSAGTNMFKYCDFTNFNTALTTTSDNVEVKFCSFQSGGTAVWMRVYGGNRTMVVPIMNCVFSNLTSQAIYGEAQAHSRISSGFCVYDAATLKPSIRNCRFYNTSNGCSLKIFGEGLSGCGVGGPGSAVGQIMANLFENLTGTALALSVGSGSASSQITFLNNTLVNCRVGTDATDPWDARIQDNIFIGGTNGCKVSGNLSRSVSYNDFYSNRTNFTGYPMTFGQVLISNRNGIPSDILYNIFQDPLFVSSNDFHLATNSSCIDAGTPDWSFSDMYSFSLGTSFPDLGAYGGPDACNWLDSVPKLAAQPWLTRTNNLIWLNWAALPRSEYQVQYITNLVATNVFFNVSNGHVLATDKPTALIVATNTTQKVGIYRVQSLGRRAGN